MVHASMSSIDPQSSSLLPELESRFWTVLRDALEEVLGADGELADQYQHQLESASLHERLLALHEDPIDVAAMLAAIPLTEEDLLRYDEMTGRLAHIKGTEHLGLAERIRRRLAQPAHPKITKLCVGESLVGDGNEVAHIDVIIGPRGSAAETAFAHALTNNNDGFTSSLAVLAPNLLCKPATVLSNKVTITNATQVAQMFGPAQLGVAKAVADCVAEGIIRLAEADDVFICVGVFIHWDAKDNKKIQDFNYQATKKAITRAINGEPTPAYVIAQRNVVQWPSWRC